MYEIIFSGEAKRFLKKLPAKDYSLILKKVFSIRGEPFRYLKRLHGNKFWRLRIMDYRAVVDVIVSGKRIIVLRIGHRRNVY